MKWMLHGSQVGALLGAALAMTTADAGPIAYQGALAYGVPVTGQVSGSGWLDEVASEVDFWRFAVPSGGLSITIRGTRVDSALDPVLSLFRGTTTADESAYRSEASWGGLTYIGSADDEVSNPGPGGDPLFTSGLLAAGDYTIAIGGFLSGGAGPYTYSLVVTPAAVPEPGTAWLALGGLAILAARARRKASRTG